jgi:hypothetical protein
MIKKETINRFEDSNFKTIIKPFFEKQGFKFKKRDGTKKIGDFILTFSCYCNDHYRGIYFNPTTQTPEIQYVSYLRVLHPAFNQWCKDNNLYVSDAKNSVANLCFTLPIDINELFFYDFFTPINGDPKNGLQSQDLGFISFIDLMNSEQEPKNWCHLIEQTAALADLETMFCYDAGKPGKYISLIYRNEIERAKAAAYELLQLNIKAYHHEHQLDYKQSWLSAMKQLQSNAKQFLNIELEIPTLLEWKSEQGKATGNIPIINLNWRELYTLKNLPKSIHRSFLNDDGTLMTTHSMHGYTGQIVIWDTNGQIKQHIDYNSITTSDFLGFIREKKVYFMANLLIFENGETKYLPIEKIKDGNSEIPYEWVCADVVFDASISNYIICSGKARNSYTVWFINESFEVVKTLQFQGIPKKVYTDKQWIVVLDSGENNCKVFDYNGNIIHSFETRNAMFRHQFFDNYRWLIVYGYYSYSEVYDMYNKKTFKIYGHPTFVSGYKDNFQQVEHNFGLSNIAFSPDGKYAVGSAEHGKWVAWTMPDWKRQEILPNAEYLAESLEPYVFEIDGQSYFVNNGQVKSEHGVSRSAFMNLASAIYFMENGAYFLMIVRDKLLIFNDKFQHLSTYKGFENMVSNKSYFLNYIDRNIGVFKIE